LAQLIFVLPVSVSVEKKKAACHVAWKRHLIVAGLRAALWPKCDIYSEWQEYSAS